MPRDKRLWMTFPIDFWQHPKVAPLPVDAKWAFVEMNGYSRMHDLDGKIPASMALHMWKKRSLDALVNSHPTRPLVQLKSDVYVIRDYSEHQQTVAEREAAAEVSRENGKKGGRPRKNPENLDETQPGYGQVRNRNPEVTQPKAESESESEIETDLTDDKTSMGQVKSRTARETNDSTDQASELVTTMYGDIAVDEIAAVFAERLDMLEDPDPATVVNAAILILRKAKPPVDNPTGYVVSAVLREPNKWWRNAQRAAS